MQPCCDGHGVALWRIPADSMFCLWSMAAVADFGIAKLFVQGIWSNSRSIRALHQGVMLGPYLLQSRLVMQSEPVLRACGLICAFGREQLKGEAKIVRVRAAIIEAPFNFAVLQSNHTAIQMNTYLLIFFLGDADLDYKQIHYCNSSINGSYGRSKCSADPRHDQYVMTFYILLCCGGGPGSIDADTHYSWSFYYTVMLQNGHRLWVACLGSAQQLHTQSKCGSVIQLVNHSDNMDGGWCNMWISDKHMKYIFTSTLRNGSGLAVQAGCNDGCLGHAIMQNVCVQVAEKAWQQLMLYRMRIQNLGDEGGNSGASDVHYRFQCVDQLIVLWKLRRAADEQIFCKGEIMEAEYRKEEIMQHGHFQNAKLKGGDSALCCTIWPIIGIADVKNQNAHMLYQRIFGAVHISQEKQQVSGVYVCKQKNGCWRYIAGVVRRNEKASNHAGDQITEEARHFLCNVITSEFFHLIQMCFVPTLQAEEHYYGQIFREDSPAV